MKFLDKVIAAYTNFQTEGYLSRARHFISESDSEGLVSYILQQKRDVQDMLINFCLTRLGGILRCDGHSEIEIKITKDRAAFDQQKLNPDNLETVLIHYELGTGQFTLPDSLKLQLEGYNADPRLRYFYEKLIDPTTRINR
ncbi:MAG: hypothetical protein AABX33_06405 [Nanoarchaeota archaeon]